MRFFYSLLVSLLFHFIVASESTSQAPDHITKGDLRSTDKDVREKLNQLHKVIDALQQTVKGLNSGYDQHAKENAEKMQKKFEKLSNVISTLGQQKSKLYVENKQLRQDKVALVNKISKLESQLQNQAEMLRNSGAAVWLKEKAGELKTFLEESGLENFASPRFSPVIAGIVANGVILVPMGVTTLYLLRYVKQLTLMKVLTALNLFDLGFVVAIMGSSVLLIGDAFEGLRHISEVNLVFIQIVLGGLFWLTCAVIVAGMVQNRRNKGCKMLMMELGIRVAVAVDYRVRVWKPVIEREDVGIAVPVGCYFMYLVGSVVALKLTAAANGYAGGDAVKSGHNSYRNADDAVRSGHSSYRNADDVEVGLAERVGAAMSGKSQTSQTSMTVFSAFKHDD